MDKMDAAAIMGLAAQAGLGGLPNMGKTPQIQSDLSFGDALMKTQEIRGSLESEIQGAGTKATAPVTKSTSANVKTPDEGNSKAIDSGKDNIASGKDKTSDLKEEVAEAVNVIKEKIKENFNVTDEDIEEAMEVLGLVIADLFNGADLRSLVMELTGTADSIELLTNVELYDGVKEITQLSENLLNEISTDLGISMEEVTEIINDDSFEIKTLNDAEVAIASSENTEEADTYEVESILTGSSAKPETEKSIDKDAGSKEVINEVSDEAVSTILTDKQDKTEDTKEENKPEIKVEVTKTEEVRTQSPVKAEDFSKNSDSKENSKHSTKGDMLNQNQPVTFGQTVEQTVNTVGDIVETVTTYADTENILRQVTDHIKVNISENSTEMEMQLHPASLGTVNMQVTQANGQITAHLTVQNELVKAVLESQMISLQETLNEQGSKVTAIEITVANYNLDSSNGSESYSEEKHNQSQQGKRSRGINLSEIDSFDELTDEEKLTAEVMNMNGSSVNYKA